MPFQFRKRGPLPRPACGERSDRPCDPGEGDSPRVALAERAPHPNPLRASFARLDPAKERGEGETRDKPGHDGRPKPTVYLLGLIHSALVFVVGPASSRF